MFRILTTDDHYSKRFPIFFRFREVSYQITNLIIDGLNSRNIRGQLSPHEKIVSTAFYKSSMTYSGVFDLTDNGYVDDGETLVRKLIETRITLKHISKDPVARSRRFCAFEGLELLRILEDIYEYPYPKDTREYFMSHRKQIMDKHAEAREYFPERRDGTIDKKYYNNWDGISLKRMANKVGLGKQYSILYSQFSQSTHDTASTIRDFVDSEDTKFGFYDRADAVPQLLYQATRHYLEICVLVVDCFKIELRGPLAKAIREWRILCRTTNR